MNRFIVTTSNRPTERIIKEAKNIAKEFSIPFVYREKRSAASMMGQYDSGVIIIEKEKLLVQASPEAPPFFFHPNIAMLRAKHWMKTKKDSLIAACQLQQGDHFYDATLGLSADAILASIAIGKKGRVVGTEISPVLAYVVQKGLQFYQSNVENIDNAMRRIEVVNKSYAQWLKEAPNNSVDIVYFDPMFEEAVSGSNGFDLMRPLTMNVPVTHEVIEDAKRVARKRVVLKDHFRSQRFLEFGFQVQVRPSATYHYGTIEMEGFR